MAVLAGLVISGVVVVSHNGREPGGMTRPGSGGEQALVGRAMAGFPFTAAASGRPGHRPATSTARAHAGKPVLRLLRQAAQASRSVRYEGVEVLDGWSQTGAVTSIVRVWHTPGAMTLTQAVTPVPGWSGEVPHILLPASSFGGQTLAGAAMLGMSQGMVTLLAANYRAAAAGWGEVAGRRARVVTARWRGGGVAARFWLDTVTTLVLRRQTYSAGGQVVSNAAFAQLRLGDSVRRRASIAVARPWGDTLAPAQLTALRTRGWPLPGLLSSSLALLGARQDSTPAGTIVDLDYSDGLSVVSVFLQRGHLPRRLKGWSEVVLRGCRVYAVDSGGQGIAWSARGFVYTLVAAAPPQTLGQVVAALPHDSGPGFVTRLSRGLHRFMSWLSPQGW